MSAIDREKARTVLAPYWGRHTREDEIAAVLDALDGCVQPPEGAYLTPEEARRAAGWWDMTDGKYGIAQADLDLVRKLEASA